MWSWWAEVMEKWVRFVIAVHNHCEGENLTYELYQEGLWKLCKDDCVETIDEIEQRLDRLFGDTV
ncbi:hypothetical protein [Rhodoligotrophos defluvii]|uniref:hypothetical protein n=1 Tax=Rhodoligotrophos defluvii TaxID=2561934 RepID=UPI0010C98684|nr:hypothetical protein [Rhodoligotrophos defluvii]